jgi:hypothetical protein
MLESSTVLGKFASYENGDNRGNLGEGAHIASTHSSASSIRPSTVPQEFVEQKEDSDEPDDEKNPIGGALFFYAHLRCLKA